MLDMVPQISQEGITYIIFEEKHVCYEANPDHHLPPTSS